jgi:quercetin dioxygenase-like cupin family protein
MSRISSDRAWPQVSFDAFHAAALATGFDETLERVWAPGAVLDLHTHPFDGGAVRTQGEMWLSGGDETPHLRLGGSFRTERSIPHSERYGTDGATYWVARRNAT